MQTGMLGHPAQHETHGHLEQGGHESERRLGPAHQSSRHRSQNRRLRQHCTNRTAAAENYVHGHGHTQRTGIRKQSMPDGQQEQRCNQHVNRPAAGQRPRSQSSSDGAKRPAGLNETVATRAHMQEIIGQGHDQHVGADHASHHAGVGQSQRQNGWLRSQIGKHFVNIGQYAGFSLRLGTPVGISSRIRRGCLERDTLGRSLWRKVASAQ